MEIKKILPKPYEKSIFPGISFDVETPNQICRRTIRRRIMRPTADNSGHTAKHRSVQIAKATSYVRKTLSETSPRFIFSITDSTS